MFREVLSSPLSLGNDRRATECENRYANAAATVPNTRTTILVASLSRKLTVSLLHHKYDDSHLVTFVVPDFFFKRCESLAYTQISLRKALRNSGLNTVYITGFTKLFM